MKRVWIVVLAILLLQGAVFLVAAAGSGYRLTRWAVSGGGNTRRNEGKYIVSSTVGQPGAGALTSSDYSLGGGFLGGKSSSWRQVYLPLILRDE
jgi:hypothetical protein